MELNKVIEFNSYGIQFLWNSIPMELNKVIE
jgi:hypothetical protein